MIARLNNFGLKWGGVLAILGILGFTFRDALPFIGHKKALGEVRGATVSAEGPGGTAVSFVGDNNSVVFNGVGGQYEPDEPDEPDCQSCAQFTAKNWDRIDGFGYDGNIAFLYPKLDENNTGRMMFYKEKLKGDFRLKYTFFPSPSSEQYNAVLEIEDIFRCVIGDGDRRAVRCHRNALFPAEGLRWERLTPMNGPTGNPLRPNTFFDPKHEIRVDLDAVIDANVNVYNITMTVSGFAYGQADKKNARFTYEFSVPAEMVDRSVRLGVGVLDPKRTGNIGFLPTSFEVQLHPKMTRGDEVDDEVAVEKGVNF